jgi:hypothetical protein
VRQVTRSLDGLRSWPVRLALCALMLALPRMAAAQSGGWDGRVRVSVNGGVQASTQGFSESISLPKNGETETIAVTTDAARSALFDAGVVVRVKGGFGVGVAVSHISHDANASINALVPHPFFFNQPRTVTGTTPLTRREIATHVDATYVISSASIDLLLSGGVSIFSVSQQLVTDVQYAETYPYDTATFTSATTAGATAAPVGYNAGADITWKLARHFGVGGLVRYSRATVTLTSGSISVSDHAGGLQAGGGLRIAF